MEEQASLSGVLRRNRGVLLSALVLAIVLVATFYLVPRESAPFIYERF